MASQRLPVMRISRRFVWLDPNFGEVTGLFCSLRKLTIIGAFALPFFLFIPCLAQPPSFAGHWEGAMVREGAELKVSFDFATGADGLKGSFNSPSQRAIGIPLQRVTYLAPKI